MKLAFGGSLGNVQHHNDFMERAESVGKYRGRKANIPGDSLSKKRPPGNTSVQGGSVGKTRASRAV